MSIQIDAAQTERDRAKYGLNLRPVTPEDAAFIVAQRRHPRARPYLGVTSARIEDQQAWILAQQQRRDDCYWLCTNASGAPLGTIGLYGRQDTQAEWGRFLIRPGSSAAIGCLFLLLRTAFESLNLSHIYCNTVASNARAIAFYERAGFVYQSMRAGEVHIDGERQACVHHTLNQREWHELKGHLERAARDKKAQIYAQQFEVLKSMPMHSQAPQTSKQ